MENIEKQINEIWEIISKCLSSEQYFQIILSKPKQNDFQKVRCIPVFISETIKIKTTKFTDTQAFTEVLEIDQLRNFLINQLNASFQNLDLQNSDLSFHIKISKKGRVSSFKGASKITEHTIGSHNNSKNYAIQENEPFLIELGLSSKKGFVLPKYQKKYKQINRYIELIDHLIKDNLALSVVDMGSGKGYLTFALYSYLNKKYINKEIKIVGYEIRKDLVDKCNETANILGFKNLSFVQQSISDAKVEKVDLLVALHACDIATDMAIQKGIDGKAKYIVLSPCCHKQIRKAMTKTDEITKHGIYKERQAEMITDTIRTLIMESKGYSTSIFEFISSEHTAKNTMITGQFNNIKNEKAFDLITNIKQRYGVKEHYLEKIISK